IGRVGRPLPGVVDGTWALGEDPRECRAEIIADSHKPDALVLDFVGVTGRHSVVTPADVLGGSEAARRSVKRAIEAGERTISVADAIAAEDSRLARRRAALEEKDRAWALRHGLELPAARVDAYDVGIRGLGGTGSSLEEATPIQPSQAKKLFLMG